MSPSNYMACATNEAAPLIDNRRNVLSSTRLALGAAGVLVICALVASGSPRQVALVQASRSRRAVTLRQSLDADLCDTFKQSPIDLLTAAKYAVLAGSTVTNIGASNIKGDLGVSPGSAVTGFPPGLLIGGGVLHAADGSAAQAHADLGTAMGAGALLNQCFKDKTGNLGGMTLTPGLYTTAGSMEISSGDLTLDAKGDASAVFIFRTATTLITTEGRQVFLAGGATAANIFWLVGSSATLGGTSVMHGNVMADQSITVSSGATVTGRVLAKVAAVSLKANAISLPQ